MAGAFLASLVGALFVVAYTNIHGNNARHTAALRDLPSPSLFYYRCAPWALLVAAAMAIARVLIARKGRAPDYVVDIYIAFGWLFALAWPLGCILAWELPWMLIGGTLR